MIELRLLGAPRIEIAGHEVQLPYQKLTALLAYLAVTGRRHSRAALATLLWGQVDDDRARNSLRSALSTIRRETAPATLLETDQELVYLDMDDVWLDVNEFRAALRSAQTVTGLTDALELWRGPFLDGLSLDGAPEFDIWLTTTRDQLDRLHEDGWLSLSRALETAGQWSEAIEAVQRLLRLDPLREAGHRQLMRLYLKQGNRTAALQQYERCRTLLAEELGVVPDARTRALHNQALTERTPAHLMGMQPSTAEAGGAAARVAFEGFGGASRLL